MFLYSKWFQTALVTRDKIAKDFGIERKNGIEVFANEVKSDGYLVKDIEEKLTKEAMQQILNTTEDELAVLFDMLVEKYEYVPPAATTIVPAVSTTVQQVIIKADKIEVIRLPKQNEEAKKSSKK